MLTSITPFGERGRGQRWPITIVFLFAGHLAGGAALGILLACTGAGLRVLAEPDPGVAVAMVASLVVLTAAFDVSGHDLPGRRQVDETWLSRYRGWVYGAGFGFQLGFGLVTVVNTSLVVPMLVAGLVLPGRVAIILGVVYGGVRGLGAVAGAGVRTIDGLRSLHHRIDQTERLVRVGSAVLVAALSVGLAVAA